jgi:hypothetical protein
MFTDVTLSPMELTRTNGKWKTVGRHVATAVDIAPGVQGPREVEFERIPPDAAAVRLKLAYDKALSRYMCTEFWAYRHPDVAYEGEVYVTSESLRETTLATWIATALNISDEPVIWQLPNPDDIEPWGLTPPKGLNKEGPTDRALQWTAHLYRCALAVGLNPASQLEKRLKLSHSTAARWIRLARQKNYLGPSEGPGRAAA